jgi:hypothetical protein
MAYSKAKLKSNGDNAPPCFEPISISFKRILISLISFMGTPNAMRKTHDQGKSQPSCGTIKIKNFQCSKEKVPQDTYNANETGLCYNLLPDRTITVKDDPCQMQVKK